MDDPLVEWMNYERSYVHKAILLICKISKRLEENYVQSVANYYNERIEIYEMERSNY